jgi:hypothetical protein
MQRNAQILQQAGNDQPHDLVHCTKGMAKAMACRILISDTAPVAL